MLAILLVLVWLTQDPKVPILEPGMVVEGVIEESDPVIETEALLRNHADAPVRGVRHRIRITAPGAHHVDLRSHFFDGYLVLRDEKGDVLVENDDGWVAMHPRIALNSMAADRTYFVDACALHGDLGKYEIRLLRGIPDEPSESEKQAASLRDARRGLEVVEASLGREHPSTGTSLFNLASLLGAEGRHAEASPLFDHALEIRMKVLGPDHPQTLQAQLALADSLHEEGVALSQEKENAHKAKDLLTRALQLRKGILGPGHAVTANTLHQLGHACETLGQLDDAKRQFLEAVSILEALEPDRTDTTDVLDCLAVFLEAQGLDIEASSVLVRAITIHRNRSEFGQAKELLDRVIALQENVLGTDHLDTASSLSLLSDTLWNLDQHTEAQAAAERAIAIQERSLGSEHVATATTQWYLAQALDEQGDVNQAQQLYVRALGVLEKALGPNDLAVATIRKQLGDLLLTQGRSQDARALIEKSLAVRERAYGTEDTRTLGALSSLGWVYRSNGDYSMAREITEKTLRILETTRGPRHPDTATVLCNLATLHHEYGYYSEAKPLFRRAGEIRAEIHGEGHPSTFACTGGVAIILAEEGDLENAIPLLRSLLSDAEEAYGRNDRRMVVFTQNLAASLVVGGKYDEAIELYERARRISEAENGTLHLETAVILNNLAHALKKQGKYEEARPVYEQALAIHEELKGPRHPSVARVVSNLSQLLQRQANYEEARLMMERAVKIDEEMLGRDHPTTAIRLVNLAGVIADQKQYDEAEALLERALPIIKGAYGLDSKITASVLNNIGALHAARKAIELARPYYEQALAIRSRILAADHPDIAISLENLGLLLVQLEEYDEAKPILLKALAMQEEALGPRHPDTARTFDSNARLHDRIGDTLAAVEYAFRSLALRRGVLDRQLPVLSEMERFQLVAEHRRSLEHLLTMVGDLGEDADQGRVYSELLFWKGMVSRGIFQTRAWIRERTDPKTLDLLEQLRAVLADLSVSYHAIAGSTSTTRSRLENLRFRRNALERELSQRTPRASDTQALSLSDVQKTLEGNEAILDFVIHGGREESKRQVSAFLIRGTGPVAHVDLGPEEAVDQAIRSHLARVSGKRIPLPGTERGIRVVAESKPLAGKAGSLLWEPFVEHLQGMDRIFICPDGQLATVSFETLPGENPESYLIENHAFVYLQSAFDLVGQTIDRPYGAGALLIGGVDYDSREESGKGVRRSGNVVVASATGDLLRSSRAVFERLGGTSREVKVLADLFRSRENPGDLTVLTGNIATEERVKGEVAGMRYIHLATHGFFAPEGIVSRLDRAIEDAEERRRPSGGYLPGLLSGLVLSGANLGLEQGKGTDDGILTAEEGAWLDLGGCEMATLSACETGLGTPKGGENLIGLRRALHLAGARSTITSLWKVSDDATQELMQDFYARLWLKGQGKLEALRGAQLDMLKKNRIENNGHGLPSTWGAFVLDGDWR